MTNPSWSAIKAKYPIGHKVEGTIKRVWQFGARVELEPGVTGQIRNKELSWDQQVSDATTYFHQGQPLTVERRVMVSVLRHDPRGEELLLSLRRAIYDPWEHQSDRYRVGAFLRNEQHGEDLLLSLRRAIHDPWSIKMAVFEWALAYGARLRWSPRAMPSSISPIARTTPASPLVCRRRRSCPGKSLRSRAFSSAVTRSRRLSRAETSPLGKSSLACESVSSRSGENLAPQTMRRSGYRSRQEPI